MKRSTQKWGLSPIFILRKGDIFVMNAMMNPTTVVPQIKLHNPLDNEEIEVDEKIAHLLKKLWKCGIYTWQSCGGHLETNGYDVPYIAYDIEKTPTITTAYLLLYMADKKHEINFFLSDRDRLCLVKWNNLWDAQICGIYAHYTYTEKNVLVPIDPFIDFEKDLLSFCDYYGKLTFLL